MSTNNLQKAEAAINQFTNQTNLGPQRDTLNRAAVNLGTQFSSNYNPQQNTFTSGRPLPSTSQIGQVQGNPNLPIYQNQQFLNPNTQTFTNAAPLSYSPQNFGQFGYLQNNVQRILGATAPQTYMVQSRTIQNRPTVNLPVNNLNTISNVSIQPRPAGQFNGTSKIQYVPYNRKIVQYEERQRKQVIPRTRKVIQMTEQSKIQYIPREVSKIDYYAIQRLKQYVPEVVPEVHINYVTKAVPYKRIQYVPVTRQVYHGAPLGGEGVQNLGMCSGVQMPMAAGSPWLNSFSPYGKIGGYGAYGSGGMVTGGISSTGVGLGGKIGGVGGYRGIYGMYGGVIPYNCCDQFKRRASNLYDNYQSYIPSFQY